MAKDTPTIAIQNTTSMLLKSSWKISNVPGSEDLQLHLGFLVMLEPTFPSHFCSCLVLGTIIIYLFAASSSLEPNSVMASPYLPDQRLSRRRSPISQAHFSSQRLGETSVLLLLPPHPSHHPCLVICFLGYLSLPHITRGHIASCTVAPPGQLGREALRAI